jgi:uncharacterized protein YoxC
MSGWLTLALALSIVAVSAALVFAILSLRQVFERLRAILVVVEQEVGPLATEARGLTTDARDLTRETTRELRRTGEVLDQVHEAAAGVARVVNALAKLTRAGQLVGLATGLRRGVDVFVERFRKNGGAHHGQ